MPHHSRNTPQPGLPASLRAWSGRGAYPPRDIPAAHPSFLLDSIVDERLGQGAVEPRQLEKARRRLWLQPRPLFVPNRDCGVVDGPLDGRVQRLHGGTIPQSGPVVTLRAGRNTQGALG